MGLFLKLIVLAIVAVLSAYLGMELEKKAISMGFDRQVCNCPLIPAMNLTALNQTSNCEYTVLIKDASGGIVGTTTLKVC